MAEPNSGRIGRSPYDVARIRRMLSSSSRSRRDRAIPPVAEKRRGKLHPAPMKSSLIIAVWRSPAGDGPFSRWSPLRSPSSIQLDHLAADLDHPAAFDLHP